MKKMYSAPVMEVEKFDVEDVILESGSVTPTSEAQITGNGTDGYEVVIQSKW